MKRNDGYALPLDKDTKGGIPDSTEYIRAVRCWYLISDGKGLRLGSHSRYMLWEPHQPVVSSCTVCGSNTSPYGEHVHTCGIYAMKIGIDSGSHSHSHCVMGHVALWGVVHEHAWGYRAQYAYPVAFGFAGSEVTAYSATILELLRSLYLTPWREELCQPS